MFLNLTVRILILYIIKRHKYIFLLFREKIVFEITINSERKSKTQLTCRARIALLFLMQRLFFSAPSAPLLLPGMFNPVDPVDGVYLFMHVSSELASERAFSSSYALSS